MEMTLGGVDWSGNVMIEWFWNRNPIESETEALMETEDGDQLQKL